MARILILFLVITGCQSGQVTLQSTDTGSQADVCPLGTKLAYWYPDADGDGYGRNEKSKVACEQPLGYVADNTDCDDSWSKDYPGAVETCDGRDNDCNGVMDDDYAVGAPKWFIDKDRDGYGDPNDTIASCWRRQGLVFWEDATDCDDADDWVYPGAPETCGDGVVNDCDEPDGGESCQDDCQGEGDE